MSAPLILLDNDFDEPARLWCGVGLDEVESRMVQLAVGTRLARSGLMVQEHLSTGGKRIRARLALAAAAALGQPRSRAIGWAAACELLHNATLIHDDIQDGDTTRRGEPTTWVRHGVAQAINAGDLMLMLPFLALEGTQAPAEVRWQLSLAMARAAELTVRGQSFDMDMLHTGRLGWSDWVHAAMGKTGALFGLPVEGAALLAGLDTTTANRLSEEFRKLGLIFQLNDDLLDLSPQKGRAPGSDLYAGKPSAVMVAHLDRQPEDTDWLMELLSRDEGALSPEEVAAAIARFEASGAVDMVRLRLRRLAQSCVSSPWLSAVPDLRNIALEILGQMNIPVEGC